MSKKSRKQTRTKLDGLIRPQVAEPESVPHPVQPTLRLQRKAGNQAVQRLLDQRAGFGSASPASGTGFDRVKDRDAAALKKSGLQFKLTVNAPVNAPDDAYEQEADRVADVVLKMPGEAPGEEDRLRTDGREIQRQESGNGPSEASADVEERVSRLQGAGQPLPDSERDFFEERMGADLGEVRLHTDSNAAEANRSLNARAFTLGRDIAFNRGEYQPASQGGRKLLAHELTHVLQQRTGLRKSSLQRRRQDKRAGDAGSPTDVSPAPNRVIQTKKPPQETTEEARIGKARKKISTTVDAFATTVKEFEQALDKAKSFESALQTTQKYGADLWKEAVQRIQGSKGKDTDDRPLYWARLQMSRLLRNWKPPFELTSSKREVLLEALEDASRGRTTAGFQEKEKKKILISGFDPFGLDQEIGASNPSGAAALALDGQTIDNGKVSAEIQAVVFPVRFEDFNQGTVEKFFKPYLQKGGADMILTISMGRVGQFDIERFPGRRRSSGSFADNAGQVGGGTPTSPAIPPMKGKELQGDEFLEMSLPVKEMRSVQTPYPVKDRRTVTTLEKGEFDAKSLAELLPDPKKGRKGQTAVKGSGGGFLSNEISYRTLLLPQPKGVKILVGHLHTPSIRGNESAQRNKIVAQIKKILIAALPAL